MMDAMSMIKRLTRVINLVSNINRMPKNLRSRQGLNNSNALIQLKERAIVLRESIEYYVNFNDDDPFVLDGTIELADDICEQILGCITHVN
jgi:hypothetical protein